jgi:hypothetical protein
LFLHLKILASLYIGPQDAQDAQFGHSGIFGHLENIWAS